MSSLIVYRKINWKVDNISRESLYKCSKNKSVSKTITVNFQDNKTQWILEFFPNTDPCEFFVFKLRADEDNISIKARLFVKKFDGNLQYIHSGQINSYEFDENEGFPFSNMFRPQDMLAENNISKDNSVTFVIELEIQELDLNAPTKSCPPNDQLLSMSDYIKIQGFEKLSDFKLVCSDQEEIQVHKFVIALKCPVLMEMIDAETSDYGNNKIKLNDIDSKTMKALLVYLYTGVLEKNHNLSSSLLYAAEKFQLNNLKTICISCLSDNLHVRNVLETFILADHYNDKILEENCIGFIKMKFHQLKDSEGWSKLSMRHALKLMDSMEMSPIVANMRSSLN